MSIFWQITSLLLLRSCTTGFSMNDGIVGGKVSVPHSRPYMVYIQDSVTKEACGGFLIREDFVMTAAHCKQNHLMAYLGANDTNFLPAGVAVEAFPHPKFNMDSPDNDIMLLKLKTPATLNKTVNTILWKKTKKEKVSKNCMVLGWGWQDREQESPSNVLKEENVTLIDSVNCGGAGLICTQGTNGAAMGDSGGPLVCGHSARGIVSFYTKLKNNYLTRYTHISHYHEWIEEILNCGFSQHQYETWKRKLMNLF